jgi:hypothetical protein
MSANPEPFELFSLPTTPRPGITICGLAAGAAAAAPPPLPPGLSTTAPAPFGTVESLILSTFFSFVPAYHENEISI